METRGSYGCCKEAAWKACAKTGSLRVSSPHFKYGWFEAKRPGSPGCLQQLNAVRVGGHMVRRPGCLSDVMAREPGDDDGLHEESIARLLVERAKVLLNPPSWRHLNIPILHVASEGDAVGKRAGGAMAWGLSCGV